MSSSSTANSDQHISFWFTPQKHLLQKMSRGTHSETWTFAGLLRQGETHRIKGIACDDYAKGVELNDGTFIAVVCDGAGSAAKGGIGSRVCAEKFIEYMITRCDQEPLTDEDVRKAFSFARAGLEEESARYNLPIETFSTTMVAIACLADSTIFAQIGDGFAVAHFADSRLEMPLIPDRGEFANQTYFVTSKNWLESMYISTINEPCIGCTLSTDGLQSILITPDNKPHEPFFTKMFEHTKHLNVAELEISLREFLSSNMVNAKVSDDATIVTAVRKLAGQHDEGNPKDLQCS